MLEDAFERGGPELRPILDELLSGRRLTRTQANALREAIGDELARTGVDARSGEVNERGRSLDDLIDRVGEWSDLFKN